MNKKIYLPVLIFVVIFFPLILESTDIQTDLNGFRLLQFKDVAEKYFGKPFDTIRTSFKTAEAYLVDSNAYMVFEYDKSLPNNICSIQLTGNTNKVLRFKGLIPGDNVQKVNDILGKPSKTKKIESPDVTQYSYEGANYTIEINDKDKLYSIKIYCTNDLMQKTDGAFQSYNSLKFLVLSKDIKGIVEMLRPDVEIFKNGEVLSIKQRYSDFINNPDEKIIAAFLGDTDSIIKEMKESEPEGEIRLIKGFGAGEVYKFYNGKILKEIVFFPYNGKYRVYEIVFRGK